MGHACTLVLVFEMHSADSEEVAALPVCFRMNLCSSIARFFEAVAVLELL